MAAASATPTTAPAPVPRWPLLLFVAAFLFHLWGVSVGFESYNLPGVEFRQAQTALSAHFIKQEKNFSLEYPTPVLGKPWSIPMEFPLYQWTVVATGRVTGLGVTKSGRLVSIACLWLALPALWLLLARWAVAPAWRWLVLALVVTFPLHIFYGRAVLIESMALAASLWFWVAYERAVAQRSVAWALVAAASGAVAGLVKVTTFLLYLLPTAGWSLRRLWLARASRSIVQDMVWMAAIVAVPLAASIWWVKFADAVKARNPMADLLVSDQLRGFNLGTAETRFSPELWAMKWRIVTEELTWWPAVLGAAVLALLVGRARWREILGCIAVFGAALVIFPALYAYHDYYFVANAVLLVLAMGLALVAVAERATRGGLVVVTALALVGGQAYGYLGHYYLQQRGISTGGNGLSDALKTLTRPDEYLVIVGQDWNAMTPYYAQRRALMIRDSYLGNRERLAAAWRKLEDEKLGALVITGPIEPLGWLVEWARARGLEEKPLLHWRDTWVFLPAERRTANLMRQEEFRWHEVALAEGVEALPLNAAGVWVDMAELRRGGRQVFAGLGAQPVRFFQTFGPNVDARGGQYRFGAHPVTRLVFARPAGPQVLRTTVQFSGGAYSLDLSDGDATDGAEVALFALQPSGEPRQLFTRLINPRANPADRGPLDLEIEFDLPAAGEVELFIGPGPAGRDTKDWVSLGPISFEARR